MAGSSVRLQGAIWRAAVAGLRRPDDFIGARHAVAVSRRLDAGYKAARRSVGSAEGGRCRRAPLRGGAMPRARPRETAIRPDQPRPEHPPYGDGAGAPALWRPGRGTRNAVMRRGAVMRLSGIAPAAISGASKRSGRDRAKGKTGEDGSVAITRL